MAQHQPGDVDPTFKTGNGPNATVYAVAVQPGDGKVILGGNFLTYNSTFRNRIVRLNTNGSVDTSFNPGSGANGIIYAIAIQPTDGKIVIGGIFTKYNGTSVNYIARLNTDGSLDTSFVSGTNLNGVVYAIAIQPTDGKILIAGGFNLYGATLRGHVARLNTNGTLDSSFDTGTDVNNFIYTVAVQSDGKILFGGKFTNFNNMNINYLVRVEANGTLDTTFIQPPFNGEIRNIVIQPDDNKILVTSNTTSCNNFYPGLIMRLHPNGSCDDTFKFSTPVFIQAVFSIAVQSDGKIIYATTGYFNGEISHAARLNSDGSSDTSFTNGSGTGPNQPLLGIAIQPNDGKIIIVGEFRTYNGVGSDYAIRLNLDGTVDTGFNSGTGANETIYTIATQPNDGKVLIGGSFSFYNGAATRYLARLNLDGTLDSSFNMGSGVGGDVRAIALQPNDGKILIGGYFTSYNNVVSKSLARLNTDGSLDTSFNVGGEVAGIVQTIAVQPNDGKILVGAGFTSSNGVTRTFISRFNPDGSLDTSFNASFGEYSEVDKIVVQPSDGKILLVGYFYDFNSKAFKRLVRLNIDGSLDTGFNIGSGPEPHIYEIAQVVIQPSDGKILVTGFFTSFNGIETGSVARLNIDGSLDTSFNTSANLCAGFSAAIQPDDGKIVIIGRTPNPDPTQGYYIGCVDRLNSDGSRDTGFSIAKILGTFPAVIAVQADKIYVGGNFTAVNNYTRDCLVRLYGQAASSSVALTSSSNPAQLGQSVQFSALVTPSTASGLVTFTFNGLTSTTASLVGGVATYVTSTLAGTYTVTASYSGNVSYTGSTSAEYTQVVSTVPSPQVITLTTDDGLATTNGTFSYALANTTSGLISFALPQGNKIIFSGPLMATLKAGVGIDGGVAGIILDGNGISGDGLQLGGNNILTNLTLRHFGGRELLAGHGVNPGRFYHVIVEA